MPRHNDDRFCPSCIEVIKKALESIPVKYRKKFVKTEDYTKGQIVNAQEERCSKPTGPGLISFPAVRRIMPGLFDMKDPSNRQNQVLEMMPDPVTGEKHYYSATWWSKKPDEVDISKEVWWDIQEKKVADNQRDYHV
jgi:hypothetical protein